MSKFLSKKKKLIEDVFEKASSETTEQSFSGIAKALERSLLDDLKVCLSYKSFENYYSKLVENDEDYNIKPLILDDLSRYLDYNSFREYCEEWKTVEYSTKESISKVVINIVNKPLLRMPEFLTKHSSLGIAGAIICGSFLVGSKVNNADGALQQKAFVEDKVFQDKYFDPQEVRVETVVYLPQKSSNITISAAGSDDNAPKYMYWDGHSFVASEEGYKGPEFKVVPMDENQLRYFQKITRTDTITERSLGKIWYSKYKNVVEFFTADGVNPENGKELKHLTKHMFDTYIE